MSEQPPRDAIVLNVTGMTCASCQIHVQRALAAVPGVASASVNLMAHTAHITAAAPIDPAALIAAVRNSGYDASLPTEHTEHHNDTEPPHLALRTLLALIAGAIAMLLSMPLSMHSTTSPGTTTPGAPHLAFEVWMSAPPQLLRWLLCALALATMLFAAPEIYTAAFRAARHRATNMNTLIALGTLAAFASSFAATLAPAYFARHNLASGVYYEAVVFILAFLLAGRWLEARARTRATSALRGFAQLQPPDARLLTLAPSAAADGIDATDYSTLPETLLPLSAIEPGDLIRVLPGDLIPLDGLILHGRSSIDESMLTGEPLPATRTLGDRVFAGALNLDGPLVLRATAVGSASTLAQMQRLLEQAQSSRAPMQRLADRASSIFVPSVLALSALTFIVWLIAENTNGHGLVYQGGIARALSIAIAVLIIACPCAMGLAVPAAITVSIGRAAQSGLLIKGGEALERLAAIDTIALDKTGTLTEGRPRIAAFIVSPHATLDPATLLTYAAAAERLSTHPLAQAVVDYHENSVISTEPTINPVISTAPPTPNPATSTEAPSPNLLISTEAQRSGEIPAFFPAPHQILPTITGHTTLPGIGLTATIDRRHLALGNATLLTTTPPPPPAHLAHATPLYLLLDHHLEAVFYATDTLRSTAAAAIAQLNALRLHPILLTGDTAASAAPIAQAAGITNPKDIHAHLLPSAKLAAIRTLQQQGHKVAMAGDGINDAAALAQANAGLALASGTGLAREAGDILLLHPDLTLIPLSIQIARRTTRIMRQNLGWAIVYNLIGIPLAAGVLYPHFHILLSPILASAAMALSSVSVLANSLRLRALPNPPSPEHVS